MLRVLEIFCGYKTVSSVEICRVMPFVAWTTAPVRGEKATLGVNYVQASQSELHVPVADDLALTLHQDMALGVGGVLWNCGRALIEAIACHQELVRGQDILELGCGTGAVGLASGFFQPRSLWLTDLETLLPLVKKNVSQATQDHTDVFQAVEISVEAYRWGSTPPPHKQFGLVLCSDCLYEPSVFADFVQSLLDVTQPHTRVLLAYKQRIFEREEHVLLALSKLFDMKFYSLDGKEPANFEQDNVFVLLLTRRQASSGLALHREVELGGTTWALAIAHDSPLNIVARTRIDTTTPEETFAKAFAWLDTQSFDAIGIASFGPVDLNHKSSTYGFITTTPKPHWGNTDIVGVFKARYPNAPINFETDVNAPALFEAAFGGHGEVSSLCYITVGTGIGVGVCIDGKPVHGMMHPEAGHMYVPLATEDIQAGFRGTCPFHGSCAEGMAASGAISSRLQVDRTALTSVADNDPVWDTVAHYLAHVCVNLTLTVSPQVIVIGGGISKRTGLLEKIHAKFDSYLNGYVKTPPTNAFIKVSFHKDIGLVSSLELARMSLA
ncbi:unnamed protein product [Aphanomyces euteiches]